MYKTFEKFLNKMCKKTTKFTRKNDYFSYFNLIHIVLHSISTNFSTNQIIRRPTRQFTLFTGSIINTKYRKEIV